MTESRTERMERPFLPATASAKGLASFPLSSMQSRAAARSLLDSRRAIQEEGTLLRIVSVAGCDDPARKCTCRTPEAGEFAVCKCFL
jgi:hypothetical protein